MNKKKEKITTPYLFTFISKISAFYFTSCCAILFTTLVTGCENDEKAVIDWTKKVTLTEVAKKVESYLSQEGKIKAKLTAPLMIRGSAGDTAYAEFPQSLHCDFYDSTTKIETFLDAKYGKYYENLNKVYLRDSVVVISIKGDTLRCQDLWWDQNTKLFYTDNYAEYISPDKKLYPSKGIEATQDFTRVKFKYPTGTIKVKEDGFPQ